MTSWLVLAVMLVVIGTSQGIPMSQPMSRSVSSCLDAYVGALDQLEAGDGGLTFIPRCELGMAWQKVQCMDQLGLCWCVNTTTGQRLTSPVPRQPDCQAPAPGTTDPMTAPEVCPGGVKAQYCTPYTCLTERCAGAASCRVDPCNGCMPVFMDADNNVITNCQQQGSLCGQEVASIYQEVLTTLRQDDPLYRCALTRMFTTMRVVGTDGLSVSLMSESLLLFLLQQSVLECYPCIRDQGRPPPPPGQLNKQIGEEEDDTQAFPPDDDDSDMKSKVVGEDDDDSDMKDEVKEEDDDDSDMKDKVKEEDDDDSELKDELDEDDDDSDMKRPPPGGPILRMGPGGPTIERGAPPPPPGGPGELFSILPLIGRLLNISSREALVAQVAAQLRTQSAKKKVGVCPLTSPTGSMSSCMEGYDSMCVGAERCCPTDTGHRCVQPTMSSAGVVIPECRPPGDSTHGGYLYKQCFSTFLTTCVCVDTQGDPRPGTMRIGGNLTCGPNGIISEQDTRPVECPAGRAASVCKSSCRQQVACESAPGGSPPVLLPTCQADMCDCSTVLYTRPRIPDLTRGLLSTRLPDAYLPSDPELRAILSSSLDNLVRELLARMGGIRPENPPPPGNRPNGNRPPMRPPGGQGQGPPMRPPGGEGQGPPMRPPGGQGQGPPMRPPGGQGQGPPMRPPGGQGQGPPMRPPGGQGQGPPMRPPGGQGQGPPMRPPGGQGQGPPMRPPGGGPGPVPPPPGGQSDLEDRDQAPLGNLPAWLLPDPRLPRPPPMEDRRGGLEPLFRIGQLDLSANLLREGLYLLVKNQLLPRIGNLSNGESFGLNVPELEAYLTSLLSGSRKDSRRPPMGMRPSIWDMESQEEAVEEEGSKEEKPEVLNCPAASAAAAPGAECSMAPPRAECPGVGPVYYYNTTAATCHMMQGVCKTEKHQFSTIADCMQSCKATICPGATAAFCSTNNYRCARGAFCRALPEATCTIDPCTCSQVFVHPATGEQVNCNQPAYGLCARFKASVERGKGRGSCLKPMFQDLGPRPDMPPPPPGQRPPPPPQRPVQDQQRPPMPGQPRPAPGQGQPPQGQQRPAPGQGQPPQGQQRPAPGQGQPPQGQQRPAPGQGQPPQGQQRPAPGQGQPPPGQQRPAPGQGQPPQGQQRPAPGQGKSQGQGQSQGHQPPGQQRRPAPPGQVNKPRGASGVRGSWGELASVLRREEVQCRGDQFLPMQCTGGEDTCWCVNPVGRQVMGRIRAGRLVCPKHKLKKVDFNVALNGSLANITDRNGLIKAAEEAFGRKAPDLRGRFNVTQLKEGSIIIIGVVNIPPSAKDPNTFLNTLSTLEDQVDTEQLVIVHERLTLVATPGRTTMELEFEEEMPEEEDGNPGGEGDGHGKEEEVDEPGHPGGKDQWGKDGDDDGDKRGKPSHGLLIGLIAGGAVLGLCIIVSIVICVLRCKGSKLPTNNTDKMGFDNPAAVKVAL